MATWLLPRFFSRWMVDAIQIRRSEALSIFSVLLKSSSSSASGVPGCHLGSRGFSRSPETSESRT